MKTTFLQGFIPYDIQSVVDYIRKTTICQVFFYISEWFSINYHIQRDSKNNTSLAFQLPSQK